MTDCCTTPESKITVEVPKEKCKCLTEEDVRRIAAEVFMEVLEKMAKKYKFENRDSND